MFYLVQGGEKGIQTVTVAGEMPWQEFGAGNDSESPSPQEFTDILWEEPHLAGD